MFKIALSRSCAWIVTYGFFCVCNLIQPWLLRLQQSLDATPTATKNQLTQAKETKHVFGAIKDGAAVEMNLNQNLNLNLLFHLHR